MGTNRGRQAAVAPRNSAGAWYFFIRGNYAALRRRMEDLRGIGARFVRFWIPWSEVETEEGRFDFSRVDDAISTIASTGLRLDITLCSQMAPAWFWDKFPDARPLNERGEPVYPPLPDRVQSAPVSLWHPELRPRLEAFVERAFAECLDRWAPLILYLRMSMGRLNEPNYPDARHFWCYDPWARADYRARMEARDGRGPARRADVPRPAGFRSLTAAGRADFIDWYRDAKDDFVLWTIRTLRRRLKPWQRVVVFLAGSDDADAHRQAFIREGLVHPSLRLMARNFWLVERCREMGLYAQYAGVGLNVNRSFLGRLAGRCRDAGVPLYGQIPALLSLSGAPNDPELVARLIVEFGLHGLAWNKDSDLYDGPTRPNARLESLARAFALIDRSAGDSAAPPVLSSLRHTPGRGAGRVEWTTDKPCDGVVLYGARQRFPSRIASGRRAFTLGHAVEIGGLRPGVPYYYVVSSMDRSGRASCGPERTLTAAD